MFPIAPSNQLVLLLLVANKYETWKVVCVGYVLKNVFATGELDAKLNQKAKNIIGNFRSSHTCNKSHQ